MPLPSRSSTRNWWSLTARISLTPEPSVSLYAYCVRRAAGDVDRHETQALLLVLLEVRLHHADQRLAVGRDGEALHTLVRDAPHRVRGDLHVLLRAQHRDREIGGQPVRPDSLAGLTIELIDVRAVFVRDEHTAAVGRNADPFRIEPGVARVGGRPRGIEIVGSAGEVVRVIDPVQRRRAGTERSRAVGLVAESDAAAVDERRAARQQRRVPQYGRQRERQGSTRIARCETQVQRLKARDVGHGVVHERVVHVRIRPAIRQTEERGAAGIGEARADAAEAVAGNAVFEPRRGVRSEVFVRPADLARGDQLDTCVRGGRGEYRGDHGGKKVLVCHERKSTPRSLVTGTRVARR